MQRWILLCVFGGFFWFAGVAGVPLSLQAQPLDLILPTENDALLRGEEPDFYQYTERNFQGRHWHPWEGGQYGFVRNPRKTEAGIVYTRLHEGVDIKPVRRDANGEPLDPVWAVDDGEVVYVNPHPGRSSYGIYVVVEHQWSGAPFYSLYAHLSRADVNIGEVVEQGDRLGRIGYTGRGINRKRAHLHFEINMLLSQHFQEWYDQHYKSSNHHGIYNGINLRGIDVGALYKALQEDPDLTIRSFLASKTRYFRVVVPREAPLDLLTRYPWLARHADRLDSPAWEIAFTREGVPVEFVPVSEAGQAMAVSMASSVSGSYKSLTNGLLTGREGQGRITDRGKRYLELLTISSLPGGNAAQAR